MTSAVEFSTAWIRPVAKAAVPRGTLSRSTEPKTAASAAPSTPKSISHMAPWLQIRGSALA